MTPKACISCFVCMMNIDFSVGRISEKGSNFEDMI
jgi:hypothetical protein